MDYSQTVGSCPQCGSDRYSKTADGFLVCHLGHQSQVWWEEQQDEFDPAFALGRRQSQRKGIAKDDARRNNGQDSITKARIVRRGDIEMFARLDVLQRALMAQTEWICRWFSRGGNLSRGHECNISFDANLFAGTTRAIWLAYANSLNLDYDEEVMENETASMPSDSNSKSLFASDPEDIEPTDAPPIEEKNLIDDLESDRQSLSSINLKGGMPITLAILFLSFSHLRWPILPADIIGWAVGLPAIENWPCEGALEAPMPYFRLLDKSAGSIYGTALLPIDQDVLDRLERLTRRELAFPRLPSHAALMRLTSELESVKQIGEILCSGDSDFPWDELIWRIGCLFLGLPRNFHPRICSLKVEFGMDGRKCENKALSKLRRSELPYVAAAAVVLGIKVTWDLNETESTEENDQTNWPTLFHLVNWWELRHKTAQSLLYDALPSAKGKGFDAEDLVEVDWDRLAGELVDGLLSPSKLGNQYPPWWDAPCNSVFHGQRRYPVFSNIPSQWPHPYFLVLSLIEWGCGLDRQKVHNNLVSIFENRTMEFRFSASL